MPDLFLLVLQVAVVLLASRLTGMLFRKIGQPQVTGEMVTGVLLGPSLLGWLAPGFFHTLFPPASLGNLNALSQIGLVLFMFLVGLSLNPSELRGHGHTVVLISHVSIVTPFCLGAALALYLYPRLSTDNVSFLGFALFMGAAMSITAFPVLARILNERKLLHTRLGALAISCAAIDDVTGWCILGYIVVLIRSETGAASPWLTIAGAILYALAMFFVIRPLAARLEKSFEQHGHLTANSLAAILLLVLSSALATELIGIHRVFGAFLSGAIMPRNSELTRSILRSIEPVTVVLLLPLFFAYSGLRTTVGVVQGSSLWGYALLVLLVAVAGKFGGSMAAARMAGVPWREAVSVGILMNTRGLMELVILNIGLDIGVITPVVFSVMVLMAVATTLMTAPLLHWIYSRRLVAISQETSVRVA